MCSFIFRRPFLTARSIFAGGGGKKTTCSCLTESRSQRWFVLSASHWHSAPQPALPGKSGGLVCQCFFMLNKQTHNLWALCASVLTETFVLNAGIFFLRQWLALTQSTAVKQAINYTPWETLPSYYPETIRALSTTQVLWGTLSSTILKGK